MSDEQPDDANKLLHHEKSPLPDLPGAAQFLSLGMTCGVSVGLGIFVGVEADNAWHLAPWGILVGLTLGLGLAVAGAISLIRRWL